MIRLLSNPNIFLNNWLEGKFPIFVFPFQVFLRQVWMAGFQFVVAHKAPLAGPAQCYIALGTNVVRLHGPAQLMFSVTHTTINTGPFLGTGQSFQEMSWEAMPGFTFYLCFAPFVLILIWKEKQRELLHLQILSGNPYFLNIKIHAYLNISCN